MSPIQKALLILQDRINDDVRDVIPDIAKLLEPEKKLIEDTWDEGNEFCYNQERYEATGRKKYKDAMTPDKQTYLKSIYEK